jgi:hypothetical protein
MPSNPNKIQNGRRPHLVELNLHEVSMLNLGGTSHVILVSEGTETAKKVREVVRKFLYPTKATRRHKIWDHRDIDWKLASYKKTPKNKTNQQTK